MTTKFTFWTLCKQYDKIEVPIIQRDYAQGRESEEVKRIRKGFVVDYLIPSVLKKNKIELDFVYGSVLSAKNEKSEATKQIFIPLDGQQRLTTLFLLHWFIAYKEGRMNDARETLMKFTYETRPSAHDFCTKLIFCDGLTNIREIRTEIKNSYWYDDDWDNDPTISGMLTLLQTLASHKNLVTHEDQLFDLLINPEDPLISFYFIPLEKFGLTENLYIRMNARGKMLTQFENFKSEFYKIIRKFPDLLEEIKDKMEYAWVENLWDYREPDSFIVDKPFMQFLGFITEMLYFKNAKFRAESYASNFLDFTFLEEIYSEVENIKFLVFSLDEIRTLKKHEKNVLWEDASAIHDILKVILDGRNDTPQSIVFFSALEYLYAKKDESNLYDFIRVTRNLIHNTADNSRREWPKLLKSIRNLITDENVYEILITEKADDLLDGFYVPQKKEEIVKANLISKIPEVKQLLFAAEDNVHLKGNINVLLISNFISSEAEFEGFDLAKVDLSIFKVSRFSSVLRAYNAISEDFTIVWGDLLISDLYSHSIWEQRLTYSYHYPKHPSVVFLAVNYSKSASNLTLEDFILLREKKFINRLLEKEEDLSGIRNVKEQLYIYYILHRRILNKDVFSFFKGKFNFGWLAKETGFASIFCKGVEGDRQFEEINPIFQTYSSQFRYNCGLKEDNALDEEIVGAGRKHNPFKLLSDWAGK